MASVVKATPTPASYPSTGYATVGLDDMEKGGAMADPADLANAQMRLGFVRKVFGLVSAQLVVTAGVAAPMVLHAGVRSYVAANAWVSLLALVVSLALVVTLSVSETARHSHPKNLVFLGCFTVAEGVLVGSITMQYQVQAVALAAALTAAVSVGLTAYALTTRRDFTLAGGALVSALLALLFAGLLGALTRSPALHLLLAGAGAALFGAFLVYDVQLIAGGKHSAAVFSPDDYVVAAIQVYLDVVNLFLHILRFVSELQRDN